MEGNMHRIVSRLLNCLLGDLPSVVRFAWSLDFFCFMLKVRI